MHFFVLFADILTALPAPLPIQPQLRIRSGEPPNYTSHHRNPVSNCTDARTRSQNISPPQRDGSTTRRSTVAVVLNWSRFKNVRRIVSLLCDPEFEPTMKHVLVWDNNPKPVTIRCAIHPRRVTVASFSQHHCKDIMPNSCTEE